MAQPIRATRLAVSIAIGSLGLAAILRAAPETQPAAPATQPTKPETRPTAPVTQPANPGQAGQDQKAEAKPDPKADDPTIRSQRMQRDSAKNQFSHLKDLGTLKRDELLQMSLNEGLLKLEVTAKATTESQRVKVEGSNAIWAVSKQSPPTLVGGNAALNAARINQGPTHILQRVDPDVKDDNGIWSLYVSCNNNYMTFMGTKVTGRVNLHQSGNMLTASVMEWQPGGRMQSVFTARVSSIQQLRSEHPEAFRQHFQPMLQKVSDLAWLRPGPADVYSAFASIQADMKIAQRLEAILPDLDSPAFPVRDSASSRLDALGAAGVLAALRTDSSQLTDEQRGRLACFIRQNRNRTFDDPAAARKDIHFLIDALEYEDPAVRAAARREVEQVFGHPVTFDVTLTGEALGNAIDALRKEAAANAAQPATKPAS